MNSYGRFTQPPPDVSGLDQFISSYLRYVKLPASQARYICSVDGCEWTVDVPGPVFEVKLPADGFFTSDNLTCAWTGVDPDHVERVLTAHFDTHTAVEWLTTINRLQTRVSELERAQGES